MLDSDSEAVDLVRASSVSDCACKSMSSEVSADILNMFCSVVIQLQICLTGTQEHLLHL